LIRLSSSRRSSSISYGVFFLLGSALAGSFLAAGGGYFFEFLGSTGAAASVFAFSKRAASFLFVATIPLGGPSSFI